MLKSVFRVFLGVTSVLLLVLLALGWYLRSPVFLAGETQELDHAANSEILKQHVQRLAGIVPNRSYSHADSMHNAERYISDNLLSYGFEVTYQDVPSENNVYRNIIARYGDANNDPNKPLIVVGAHYDVAGKNNPGADDNASGVAALLELARMLQINQPALEDSIELVAYTLEEPPYFARSGMGSVIHADGLKAASMSVKRMYSIEMIGFYSEEWLSQEFPLPFLYLYYPWVGNFIALIGRPEEREVLQTVKKSFMTIDGLSTYSFVAPAALPGIDFSDHRSYWAHGWPAFMVTDTAFYRNEHYHSAGDTPERLNYQQMKRVVDGIYASVVN